MDSDASASSSPQHHPVPCSGPGRRPGHRWRNRTGVGRGLVHRGVVDSLASENILTADELDVAVEREEPGLSVHQPLRSLWR